MFQRASGIEYDAVQSHVLAKERAYNVARERLNDYIDSLVDPNA